MVTTYFIVLGYVFSTNRYEFSLMIPSRMFPVELVETHHKYQSGTPHSISQLVAGDPGIPYAFFRSGTGGLNR